MRLVTTAGVTCSCQDDWRLVFVSLFRVVRMSRRDYCFRMSFGFRKRNHCFSKVRCARSHCCGMAVNNSACRHGGWVRACHRFWKEAVNLGALALAEYKMACHHSFHRHCGQEVCTKAFPCCRYQKVGMKALDLPAAVCKRASLLLARVDNCRAVG
jgi:hypothetical protein